MVTSSLHCISSKTVHSCDTVTALVDTMHEVSTHYLYIFRLCNFFLWIWLLNMSKWKISWWMFKCFLLSTKFRAFILFVGRQEEHTAHKKVTDNMLVSLSVWYEVHIVCIWSTWCHSNCCDFPFGKTRLDLNEATDDCTLACSAKTQSSLVSFTSSLVLPDGKSQQMAKCEESYLFSKGKETEGMGKRLKWLWVSKWNFSKGKTDGYRKTGYNWVKLYKRSIRESDCRW